MMHIISYPGVRIIYIQTHAPYLEVRGEGVRQTHAAGKGRENEVSQLDARRRNDVAEAQVVVAQKFREVMQQHQKHAEHALVEETHGLQQGGPTSASDIIRMNK